ncbi:MAG: TGS domain-containing protein [Candidatus Peregrinibacteria bacterium]
MKLRTILRAKEIFSKSESDRFLRSVLYLQERSVPLGRTMEIIAILLEIFPDIETVLATLFLEARESLSEEEIQNILEKETILVFQKLQAVSMEEMFSHHSKKQLMKQILLSFMGDVRVLFFLLAERIYFLRHLSEIPHEMRLILAQEAIEIFAPLSIRVGIHQFKIEFEERAFAILYPEDFNTIGFQMEEFLSDTEKSFQAFQNNLQKHLAQKNITSRILSRRKNLYSIFQKLNNKGRSHITDLHDILAIRIITENPDDCYRALGCVHETGVPVSGRIKDYVAAPKGNGYQSLHTTVLIKNQGGVAVPLEVQIRDEEMDHNAEWGMASHILYKEKKSANILLSRKGLQKYIGDLEQNFKSREFLTESLSDLFKEEVFVFTNTGEVKHFPAGSTLLDFAYAVHSQIGNNCAGGIINGEKCPIDAPIHTGDKIEIFQSPDSIPLEQWLSSVKTPLAKNRIRSYLRKMTRKELAHKGFEVLKAHLKKGGRNIRDISDLVFVSSPRSLAKNTEDMLYELGSKGISVEKAMQFFSPRDDFYSGS